MIRIQPLLAVESVNAFMIIPPEHHVNPAVGIVTPGFGDLPDTQAQRTASASTER